MAFNPRELGIPTSGEEADAINARFEMQTLRNLSEKWNETSGEIEKIDLNRVKTKIEFIISLWQRGIKIPETITFLLMSHSDINSPLLREEPYDSYFSGNPDEMMGEHLTFDEEEVAVAAPIDQSSLYLMLENPEITLGFLIESLKLRSEYWLSQKDPRAQKNIEYFNAIWKELPGKENDSISTYRELQQRLRILSDLDLAYLVMRCDELIDGENLYTDYVTANSLYKTLQSA